MRKKIVCLLLFFCCFTHGVAGNNAWGELKKIYLFNSLGKYDRVGEILNQLDLSSLKRIDKKEMVSKLVDLGDYYVLDKNYKLAEDFYRKALGVFPNTWTIFNKLEKIKRDKGSLFFNLKNTFRQFSMILKDFKASFLLFTTFFKTIFFATFFIFFLLAFVLFVKYFYLAGNDILLDKDGIFSTKQIVLLLILLFWPAFILSGWMSYPFLMIGFLWIYLNDREKKSMVFMLMLIVAMTLLYSFSRVIGEQYRQEDFKVVRQVFEGDLVDKKVYDKFDNELKVLQALSFYEDDQLKIAEDILRSTGEDYRNKNKFILLGNIYYRFDNIPESIKYFRMALSLDDSSKIALNNFTMVLLKNDNAEVFKSWAKRYPEINEYKNKLLEIKEIELSQFFLWKRLFNLTRENFNLFHFLKNQLKVLLTMPVVYFILIFMGYVVFVPRLFSHIGTSTYCSKCSKIIKESSVHRSYKLCNDCYQLFMIKDVIFLEAKILKEKELARKTKKKNLIIFLISFLIPGLRLNFNNQNRIFIIFCGLFYSLMGFYVLSSMLLKKIFSVAPVFLNFVGAGAMLLYLLLNVYALRGNENGI
jgi:tetratricopeptide (TPR) repeat protein